MNPSYKYDGQYSAGYYNSGREKAVGEDTFTHGQEMDNDAPFYHRDRGKVGSFREDEEGSQLTRDFEFHSKFPGDVRYNLRFTAFPQSHLIYCYAVFHILRCLVVQGFPQNCKVIVFTTCTCTYVKKIKGIL